MTNNTVEILTSINKSVATIAMYLAPKNASGKEGTAKLAKGNLSVTDDIDSSKAIKSPNISLTSVQEFIKVLSGLPITVKKVANLSNKTIRNFQNVMESIMKIMVKLDESGKKVDVKHLNNTIDCAFQIDKLVGKFAKMSLVAPLALVGTLAVYPVILSYIGILKMIGNMEISRNLIKKINQLVLSIDPIMNVVKKSVILLGLCMGLGLLVAKGDTKNMIIGGIAVLGGTLLALTAIIGIVGLATRVLKHMGAIKGMREITHLVFVSLSLVAICVGLGALISMGDTQKLLMSGLAVLGGTLVTLTLLILLTGLAGKLIKDIGAMQAIKDIVLITFGAMGIIIASALLGDFVTKNSEKIWNGLAVTGAVLGGLMLIAIIAGRALGSAKKGVVALGVIELLAFGAMGIIYTAVKLSNLIESSGGYGNLLAVLGAVTGVLVLFGGLAALSGLIMPEIILGSIALGAAELMALGAIKLVEKIIEMDLIKEAAGTSWKQIAKDVLGIGGVVSAFGILAGAFSLLTIPIMIAMPAMFLTIKFAEKSIDVVNSLILVTKSIEDSGGIDKIKKTVNEDIPAILKSFNKKNFEVPLNWLEMGELILQYKGLRVLSDSILSTTEVVSKLSRIAGMTEGGLIRPVKRIDPKTGEIEYGEPVDIKSVATVICDTMKTFVENMSYTFEDLGKVITSAKIFKILGMISDPISAFVNMLTGFIGEGTEKEDNYTLTPVKITEKGEMRKGTPVPVKQTAQAIVKAISVFVTEIYKPENAATWSELVYGDRTVWQKIRGKTNTNTQAVNQIGGMLGLFVSPVVEFIDLISKFESQGDGKLASIIIDSNGKPQTGKIINVNEIASTITGSITTFIQGVCSITDEQVKAIEKRRKTFDILSQNMIVFTDMLSNMSNDKINLEKINDTYESVKKGTPVIIKINETLSNFNTIINKESEKRKKNIRELAEEVEKLISKFDDKGDKMKTLYELITKLENMDTDKLKDNVGLINLNGTSSGSTGQIILNKNTKQSENVLSPSEIANAVGDAVAEALSGMRIIGGTKTAENTNNETVGAIISALQSIEFTIDQ